MLCTVKYTAPNAIQRESPTKSSQLLAINYKMGKNLLEEVDHEPYLGVELSSDLTWNRHIPGDISIKSQLKPTELLVF